MTNCYFSALHPILNNYTYCLNLVIMHASHRATNTKLGLCSKSAIKKAFHSEMKDNYNKDELNGLFWKQNVLVKQEF